jgi:hypothetical protein
MLELPDVTLVIAETRAHELGRLAIEACLAKARFGGVVIHTDNPGQIKVLSGLAQQGCRGPILLYGGRASCGDIASSAHRMGRGH